MKKSVPEVIPLADRSGSDNDATTSPYDNPLSPVDNNITLAPKAIPPRIIFGLKDYPRPRNSGFFYCKPPSLFGNFSIKTLAVLDLYNTDREYITEIMTRGIECMLEDEEYGAKKIYYLENYTTENMKPFVQRILQQVIENKLLSDNDS